MSDDPGALEIEEAYSPPRHEGQFHTRFSNVSIVDIFEESCLERFFSNLNVEQWLNSDRSVLADSKNTVALDNVNAQILNLNIKSPRGCRGNTNRANKNKNRIEALTAYRHLNNLNRLRRTTEFIQARIPSFILSPELESEFISIVKNI